MAHQTLCQIFLVLPNLPRVDAHPNAFFVAGSVSGQWILLHPGFHCLHGLVKVRPIPLMVGVSCLLQGLLQSEFIGLDGFGGMQVLVDQRVIQLQFLVESQDRLTLQFADPTGSGIAKDGFELVCGNH